MKREVFARKKGNITEQIYDFMLAVLLLFSVAIMLLLSYWACRSSYYNAESYNRSNLLIKDPVWKHVILFFVASLITVEIDRLLSRKSKIVQEKICLYALTVTCALLFLVGTVYVLENPYYPVGDQINTTAFSAYCREGNFIMLEPGGYMGMHQHQKGLGLLYEIVFGIFGDFNYAPAKVLHVCWWVLSVYAGYQFLKINTERTVFRLVYCVVMIGCIPFLFFLPYIYGDIISIGFCMVLFWMMAAYERDGRKRYLAVAAFVAAIATMARKNTLIVLAAAVIYAVLLCLKKRRAKYLLTGAVVLLSAILAVKAVDVIYEYRSGYPSGIGIPSILYVAMGLQETDGEPGVYNRYHQTVFAEHDFQQEPSAEEGKAYIRDRMQQFANDPGMAWRFFKKKIQWQWIDPLYKSLRATNSFDEDREVPAFITEIYYGKTYDVLWKLSNYYQSVVYLGSLLFAVWGGVMWWRNKEVPASLWLPMIAVVGGFLFSIIWEAQSRYVFPYMVFLTMYVPEGLYVVGNTFLKLKNIRKKTNEKKEEKEESLREIA